jgi:heme A synthase
MQLVFIMVSFLYAILAIFYTTFFILAFYERKRYKVQHLVHIMIWFIGAFIVGILNLGTHPYWLIYLLVSIAAAVSAYIVSYFCSKKTIEKTVIQIYTKIPKHFA